MLWGVRVLCGWGNGCEVLVKYGVGNGEHVDQQSRRRRAVGGRPCRLSGSLKCGVRGEGNPHPSRFVCSFVLLKRYWGIITVPKFPCERARGARTNNLLLLLLRAAKTQPNYWSERMVNTRLTT